VLLGDQRPALLAAHSLGCQLVASWAEHSRHSSKVLGALLVAPPDTEREDMPPQLHNWQPIRRQKLPFPSIAVVSTDDPFCSLERGTQMAADWGCDLVIAGPRGHLNTASGLGDWPEGQALLAQLAR
jgi:predicted alpha/beta hydrolase family esterase